MPGTNDGHLTHSFSSLNHTSDEASFTFHQVLCYCGAYWSRLITSPSVGGIKRCRDHPSVHLFDPTGLGAQCLGQLGTFASCATAALQATRAVRTADPSTHGRRSTTIRGGAYCFIPPVMRELHWLPVRQRIRFKTAVLVFKCLHGLAPEYLSEYCKLTTGRTHLRSANACLLSVPHTQTTYGDRSFAVGGPVLWNSLPVALQSSDITEETFRRHLKTFLFNCLDNSLCER